MYALMKLLILIILTPAIAVPARNITNYSVDAIVKTVANTHLATIAEVKSVQWGIDPENGDEVLYANLQPIEIWSGQDIPALTVIIAGFPDTECISGTDWTRPAGLDIGGRYLFLCKRQWSWKIKSYTDYYIVPFEGIICVDGRGELRFCTKAAEFAVGNPRDVLKQQFRRLNPDSLYCRAQIVIEATGFVDASSGEALDGGQAPNPTSCKVMRVLKGPLAVGNITFHPLSADRVIPFIPLINAGDRAILFLEAAREGGWYLVDGAPGYLKIVDGRMVDRLGNDLHFEIKASQIVDKGARYVEE